MRHHDVQDKAEKLIDNATAAGEKAKRSASEAFEAASDKLSDARNRAIDALDALTERANHYARKGLDKALDTQTHIRRGIERASDATAHYVEEQPIKSVAIAAGIGAAVAAALVMLLRRDDR